MSTAEPLGAQPAVIAAERARSKGRRELVYPFDPPAGQEPTTSLASHDFSVRELAGAASYTREPIAYDTSPRFARLPGALQEDCQPVRLLLVHGAVVGPSGVCCNADGFTTSGQGASFIRRALEGGNPHLALADECMTCRLDAHQIKVTGPALVMLGPGSDNFGHLLTDFLGHALLLDGHRAGVSCLVSIAHPGLMEAVGTLLVRAGYDPDRIVCVPPHTAVSCDVALAVEGVSYHPRWMHPAAHAAVREHLLAYARDAAPNAPRGDVLYVTRGAGVARQLLNEVEVIEHLYSRLGPLTILDPSRSTVAEQIAACAAARTIVGVMGAGMTGALVAPALECLVCLAPLAMPGGYFKNLADLGGARYAVARPAEAPASTATSNDDFAITLAEIDHVLDAVQPRC